MEKQRRTWFLYTCKGSKIKYLNIDRIIEFDEEGVQFVRIIGAPALEAWLSSLRGERALRIRGPHHYIASSALKDKGSIAITRATIQD